MPSLSLSPTFIECVRCSQRPCGPSAQPWHTRRGRRIDGPLGAFHARVSVTRKAFGERPPRLERVFPTETRPVYFVTFCTHERKPWLARSWVHDAFVQFA